MKLSKILLTLLLATSCLADNNPIRNESLANLRDLGSELTVGRNFSVDQKGRTITTTSGINAGGTVQAPAFQEDQSSNSGDVVYPAGVIYKSQAAVGAGATGDYATLNVDQDGRLYTNPFGSSPAEFWQSCGTATASTSDVAIKAAVASNRIYVMSITCSNSSATTSSNLNFKDGSTVIAVGGVSNMAAGFSGAFTANFSVPLRGTVNTAFNFNTAVAVTSTICCAIGFISTN